MNTNDNIPAQMDRLSGSEWAVIYKIQNASHNGVAVVTGKLAIFDRFNLTPSYNITLYFHQDVDIFV